MGRSQETFGKKEREKKRLKKKKEKAEKKAERKEHKRDGSLEGMMAYVDEFGRIVDTPPDPSQKTEIKAENIQIGVPSREHVEEDPIKEGKVAFFNHDKGYGFIRENSSRETFFVHINNCSEPIDENDKVMFELEKGPKGMVAVRVNKV
ncbi:MAG: cold shock domain-containing protein [Bacteroidota bacterium]